LPLSGLTLILEVRSGP